MSFWSEINGKGDVDGWSASIQCSPYPHESEAALVILVLIQCVHWLLWQIMLMSENAAY